jgi:hypothetical protein
VAIETSQGPVIDQLLQTPDCTLYPLNPKAAQRYRERKAPSGTKSDHLDAWQSLSRRAATLKMLCIVPKTP